VSQHAVDLGRLRQLGPAGADPGQHLAAGVVQHQQRGILHLPALQLGQLAAQCFAGEALQVRIQRAPHRGQGAAIAQQPVGHVRRDLAGGIDARRHLAAERQHGGAFEPVAGQVLLLQHRTGALRDHRG
jgi:hypothetical protein